MPREDQWTLDLYGAAEIQVAAREYDLAATHISRVDDPAIAEKRGVDGLHRSVQRIAGVVVVIVHARANGLVICSGMKSSR